MGNTLTDLDLEAIIITKEEFDVEINGVKVYNASQLELWKKIHSEKIEIAEEIIDDLIYIKFSCGDILFIEIYRILCHN